MKIDEHGFRLARFSIDAFPRRLSGQLLLLDGLKQNRCDHKRRIACSVELVQLLIKKEQPHDMRFT